MCSVSSHGAMGLSAIFYCAVSWSFEKAPNTKGFHDCMVDRDLLTSSLPGKALRTLVDIARLAERFNMRSQSRAC